MLFFGVFLLESARTAALRRTNVSTNLGKATKRLDRLAPNLAHMPMDIRQTNCPSRHKGGIWGVLGGHKFKTLGKLSNWQWHQLWFTSVDSSGNGHRLKTSRASIPQGAFGGGGGLGGSQIQKSGQAVKWLDRLAPNLVYSGLDTNGSPRVVAPKL